jgi:hypothetical protein
MMGMRKMQLHRQWAAFVLLGCVLAIVGCGGDSAKYLPVSGMVTLDGAPLKSGAIAFAADMGNDYKGTNTPSGTITDGKYKVMTGNKDGAPVGKWKVTITGAAPMGMGAGGPVSTPGAGPLPPPAGMGGTQIAPKYMDPAKTPLKVEVKDGMDPKQFDLSVTKS